METKICTKCKKEFPATKKYFAVRKAEILRGICRECNKLHCETYRYNNKEKISKIKKKYAETEKGRLTNLKAIHAYQSTEKGKKNHLECTYRYRKTEAGRNIKLQSSKKYAKKEVDKLSPHYIKGLLSQQLKTPFKDLKISQELIEVKKNQLKLDRLCRTQNN